MQRGVVPAILHQRRVSLTRFVGRLAQGALTAVFFQQMRAKSFAFLRDHTDYRMLAGLIASVQVTEIRGDWRGEQRELAFCQPRRTGKGIGIIQRVGEIIKHVQPLNPLMDRCQCQRHLKHNTVAAIGMMQQQCLWRGHLQNAWFGFHRHDFYAEHIAGRAEWAVVNGADTAKSAAVKAAQTGEPVGGRHAAQFPSCWPGQGFNLRQPDPSLRPYHAVAQFTYLIESGHIDQNAALQWHQLAVVAGRAAAQDQRQLMLNTGFHHGIGLFVFQLPLKHRAEPVKITGKAFDLRRL